MTTRPEILKRLGQVYHEAHCALHHETPFQLLIATILSAQCTDERVNQVTPKLFQEFPTAKEMAVAPQERVEALIHSTGFFKNKAKNIIGCAKGLVEKYGGEPPRTLQELIELPGVGRKTANVLLGNAYGIPSGIVVDTHVLRLSNRMRWIRTQDAVRAEKTLQKIVPKSDWIAFSHWMIFHGRQVCSARSPRCAQCFLQDLCPSAVTRRKGARAP